MSDCFVQFHVLLNFVFVNSDACMKNAIGISVTDVFADNLIMKFD